MIRLKDFCSFGKAEVTGGNTGIDGLWSIYSDAGILDGLWEDRDKYKFNEGEFEGLITADMGAFSALASEQVTEEGVLVRDDKIVNTSEKPIHICRAYSRFRLPDGEYEVYTQWNGALNESQGAWQELHTVVAAENLGIRATCDAAPMMALHNKQNGHGFAFYLWGNCVWKIEAHNHSRSVLHQYTVDLGINEKGFNYELAPGEELALPRIIVVPFTSKLDLDAYKLTDFFTNEYGAKRMPVIYNTWMAYFDYPDLDKQLADAKLAGELGVEYYVVDAGWFGHGDNWSRSVGEWVESTDAGYKGRLKELADGVRAAGMKFGLWFEVERAMYEVPMLKEHPEWFFQNGVVGLLDFGNPAAGEYAFAAVDKMIREYGIEYLKLDFNRDLAFDPTGKSFVDYHRGFSAFVGRIREAHPGIYIEGCASGGYRIDLYNATLFDSFWVSDNQSPYHETRIGKDMLKRMPMSAIEKWPVICECDGFINTAGLEPKKKYLACHDGEWINVVSVEEEWLKAYTIGSTLGLSFRLCELSEEGLAMVSRLIEFYKEHREGYKTARNYILCDTPELLVTECLMDDCALISAFVWNRSQIKATVYPKLPAGTWLNGDTPITDTGLTFFTPKHNLGAVVIELKKG